MRLPTRLSTLLIAAVAVSQMGATDCGNALRDPGFDVWCGDQLCAWKVERGTVQRVATWNEGDPGVELVGDDVALEQLSPVDHNDGNCLEFDLIADIDPDAQVTLNVDVFGDGSVEHPEPIPTSSWAPLSFQLPIQGVYRGVRFELTKRGSGHAVLAQIGAKVVEGGCAGFAPIVPAPAPLGSPCSDATGCTSGMCQQTFFGGLCVACTDGSCPAGEVCTNGDPLSPVRELPRECVADASLELGEQCSHDADCATGICNFGYPMPTFDPGSQYGNCSACRTGGGQCDATCAGGWPDGGLHAPFLCAPGGHAAAPGAGCATDDDCASGVCNGSVRRQCDVDGRECATSTDCPFDGLQNSPCSTVGIQGGSCQ